MREELSLEHRNTTGDIDAYLYGFLEDADPDIGCPASFRLTQIRVLAERSRGLGSSILSNLENYCMQMGVEFIHATVSSDDVDAALKFYAKNGYQIEEYGGDYEIYKALPTKQVLH